MIREREGSKGIRFLIAFFFIAIFFFVVGFIVNKLFFAKEAPKSQAPSTEKEAALRKIDSGRKGDDAKKKNPIVGEEKDDFTFYKTLQNGKEPPPLKQQKTEERAQKKEEKIQKTEESSKKAEKTEDRGQKKEEKTQKTEVRSQKIEEKKHKAEDKGNKSEVRSQESGVKNKKTGNTKEKVAKRNIKDELPAKEKRFTLQVAAFKEREKAEDIAGSLKKKGYDPYIVPVTIPEKGVWYRVRIGRFATRPDAQSIQARLKKSEGISSFITFTTE
ncbi:MAG: SPOR domain-containing protein [Nitrospirae bacterium]|nr:SPOR domain-containing protein [Nitrospirota bacterium]